MSDDMRAINEKVITDFRAAGGAPGRPLLLLTTTGARTGRSRTTPMMFVADDDRLLVIASNAGALRNPDWYRNLVVHPDVTVEVTGETYAARADVTAGAERERLWEIITGQYPFFLEHQAKVRRTIPVVALVRR